MLKLALKYRHGMYTIDYTDYPKTVTCKVGRRSLIIITIGYYSQVKRIKVGEYYSSFGEVILRRVLLRVSLEDLVQLLENNIVEEMSSWLNYVENVLLDNIFVISQPGAELKYLDTKMHEFPILPTRKFTLELGLKCFTRQTIIMGK
ncbi:hypothetical protein J437_LFUL011880 [Ladona fulva]|uniref:Uncharacterized protein n=1 Tax=Ladona fulva TaxID=123851 RepID=A0A8K0KDM8_LADFU|nr:hypothetical protein J437_LFUL011880 [Ladona fulva]